jgi:hypothetical protein
MSYGIADAIDDIITRLKEVKRLRRSVYAFQSGHQKGD